jgi:cell division septation protein DedD
MQDEGFHEIQLNGKQLVFLFMAATVVAVVIFLCGVMVGRGVAVPRTLAVADVAEQGALDPTAAAPSVSTGNESLTAREELSYTGHLEAPTPPTEALKPETEVALPPPRAAASPAREPVAAAAASQSPDPALNEPAGQGYVVQVAAVRKRAEAETIARRLSTKGYPTFVTAAGANFRVRVGKYNDRRTAQSIAGRLEREERFKPWITR